MKRVVTGAAVVASLFILASCGNSNTNSSSSSSSSSSSNSSKKSALATARMDVDATFTNSKETALVKGVTSNDVKELQDEVDALPDSTEKDNLTTKVNKAVKLINNKNSNIGKTAQFFDGTSITFKDQKVYSTNTEDSSFENSKFRANGVSVSKTTSYHYTGGSQDFTGHGIIMVKYTYTAGNTDLDPMLIDATLSTDSGTQADVDTMDSNIPDTIDAGVTKKGVLVFPIETLDKISDVNSVRLKFTCYPQDDNSDDSKNYDITIPLKD